MFLLTSNITDMSTVVKIFIDEGNDEATAFGANILSLNDYGYDNPVTIMGYATFKLSQYDESYNMDWDIQSGFDLGAVDSEVTKVYDKAIKGLMRYADVEFDKNGLGFTLADIGFKSY